MGGNVPLGYECIDRKLIVIEREAELVRHIYRRYLELKNVRTLKQELDEQGYRSKVRTSAKGNISGGKKFTRGALYAILQNKHYLGLICHKEEAYPGEHDGIIEDDFWTSVQNLLIQNGVNQKHKTHAKEPSLLAGLLFDEHGNRFSPSHAVKNKKRYRYYVNQAFLKDKNAPIDAIKRIPAHEIEHCVTRQLLGIAADIENLSAGLDLENDQIAQAALKVAPDELEKRWQEIEPEHQRKLVQNAIDKVTLKEGSVTMTITKYGLAQLFNTLSETHIINEFEDQTFNHNVKATLKQCRWESRLVIETENISDRNPEFNNALLKTVAQTFSWRQKLLNGEVSTVRELAIHVGSPEKFVSRRLKLAYLSPEIVENILKGMQPPELTVGRLDQGFSANWAEQKKELRFT